MAANEITHQQNLTFTTARVLSAEWGILLVIGLFLALVATLTVTFGLPGLAMSALAMVPVAFIALMLITVGK